jgi:hypothetical protein
MLSMLLKRKGRLRLQTAFVSISDNFLLMRLSLFMVYNPPQGYHLKSNYQMGLCNAKYSNGLPFDIGCDSGFGGR